MATLLKKCSKISHFWTKNGHILANMQKIKIIIALYFSNLKVVASWLRYDHFIKNVVKIAILGQKKKGHFIPLNFKSLRVETPQTILPEKTCIQKYLVTSIKILVPCSLR